MRHVSCTAQLLDTPGCHCSLLAPHTHLGIVCTLQPPNRMIPQYDAVWCSMILKVAPAVLCACSHSFSSPLKLLDYQKCAVWDHTKKRAFWCEPALKQYMISVEPWPALVIELPPVIDSWDLALYFQPSSWNDPSTDPIFCIVFTSGVYQCYTLAFTFTA